MRKLIFALILSSAVITLIVFLQKGALPSAIPDIPVTSTPAPTPNPPKTNQLLILNDSLWAQWVEINDPAKLVLIPNFSKADISKDVYSQEQCKFLTSAGFYAAGTSSALAAGTSSALAAGTSSAYSKQSKPLGLFISDGKQLYAKIKSDLFDGFFTLDTNNNISITTEVHPEEMRLAFQTGPILIDNGLSMPIKVRNDKYARRIVAVKSTNGRVLLFVLYNPDSRFSGPQLAQVSSILKQLEAKLNLHFLEAINFDGGSASAFITQDEHFYEISPVGSFLCGK
jgi:exopolysaccharide biosynthesis protein